jgi:benzoylformate decarboxylase
MTETARQAPRPGKTAIFEQFAADGLRFMFGNPGTVEQGFLDVLQGRDDMDYVLTLHETVAVGIADGYARATGGPALVQLHSSVGLGNGIGMIYQAKRGHTPLVIVAGESGVAYDAMDAQMAADLVAMARPVTKYATRVIDPNSTLRVLRRAVKIAMTPPRGPVFVSLPMDVLDALTSEPAVPSTLPSRRTVPVTADLQRAVQLLSGARNPVMLIGDGVTVSGAQSEVTRVAELLGASVYGVDSSELNMDTTHPLYRGELGHMFGSASARAVAGADTVLIVGTYVFPEVFPSLESPFADGARIVHVDVDDFAIAKNFPVTIGLVADPAATLAAIAERLAARRAFTGAPLGHVDYSRRPALPQPGADAPLGELFAAELARQAPSGLLVFDEALTASPQLTRQLPPRTPGSYFLTRGGSLGVGIPGAIGVKIARPDAEVVGFTGDGGSMYTIQALWTAARYGIPARFVICNNSRYRLLDENLGQYWKQRDIPGHGGPSSFDLSQPPIDFPGLAAALGIDGIRVEKPAEVESAVTRMLHSSGPFLVDLVTR